MTEIDRLKFIAEYPKVKEILCPRCLNDKSRFLYKEIIIEAYLCEGCAHKFWIRRPLPIGPWK